MDIKAKLRPFYVAKLLYERTDDEHYLTIVQIMDILKKEYDITTSRGTIGDDIKVLQEFGLDIAVENSVQNRYYLISREFDLPELKLLIDATESARFIPKKKSAQLVKKLCSISSKYNATSLVRNVDVENRVKANNDKIFYIMDALNEAINLGKKVSFQYFSYNSRKQRKLKHNGQEYVFSPYKLVWNGDYYYVVGYSDKHQGVGSFRIDRIAKQPEILEIDAELIPTDFDMNQYLNTMFRMYNGIIQKVELLCENEMMDAIVDMFGKDVNVQESDDNSFIASVDVAAGKVFYGWVFGFSGKIKIISPENIKEEYREMARCAIEL